MGHNRSGDKRRARLKRHRREEERLAARMAASAPAPTTKAVGMTPPAHAVKPAATTKAVGMTPPAHAVKPASPKKK